ncbi:MAG: anti-sigma factor family protein [Pseudohongiellaceae bacterium]
MQCPESARCLSAYILDELAPSDRKAFKNHLLCCAQCSAELASFERVNTVLNSWDDEALPVSAAAHRERIRNLAEPLSKQEKASRLSLFNWWQWAPSALSFAVLMLMFMNASFLVDEDGFSVSFGGLKNGASVEQMVDREELHQVIARLEQRQDQNNIALMQAVLNQTRESSEANFQQLFAFFEQQRLNDLEQVRASYDQLAESDFETLRSLQQLASYVSFNEIVR